MIRITVDIENPSSAELENFAAYLLQQASNFPLDLNAKIEEVLRSETADPIAVFGKPSLIVSEQGPSVTVPAPPTAAVAGPSAILSGGATVDKTGLPWDERIHASSKAMNADGTWRSKRGVDPMTATQVEMQLRQVMAAPPPSPSSVPDPPPPPPPSIPVPATAEAQNAFVSLVGRASAAISAGKLTQDQLQKVVDSVGIPSLPMLAIRMDLVPQVAQLIDGIIAGQSV